MIAGNQSDRAVHRHFNQGKTSTYRGEQNFCHGKSSHQGHGKTGRCGNAQGCKHGIFVSDADDIRRNQERKQGNTQVFKSLQHRSRRFQNAVIVLHLQHDRANTIQQDGKYKVIEE